MAVSIGDIIGTIKLEDTFSPKLEVAARNVEAFASKMDQIGSRIENVGRKLTLSLTLPIAAVTGLAVKSATTINETLANVSALLTDVSGAELDQTVNSMRGKIQGLARDMGKSTKDIGEGLYEVISSLGNTDDTFGQLEISAKAASAGLATTQEAFNLLSAVTKTYGDTSEEAFEKVADLSFQAVNLGQTTFPQLSASIGSVASIAEYAGVSLEEMFAIIATATGVTGNTSEVTTQMASAISALIDPSKELNNLYKEQGIASSQAAIAEMGLVGTLQMIVDHANATGKPLADLLGRKEAIILAASLAGAQEEKFADTLTKMGEAAASGGKIVGDAFDKQTQGVNKAGFAWKQFQAEVQIALENLGDKLIPIITNAAEQLRPLWEATLRLLDAFGKLPQSTQTIIVSLVGLVVLTGPVMMLFGGMLSGVSALLPLLSKLAGAYRILTTTQITAYAIGSQGTGVILGIAAAAKTATAAVVSFATSITGIGIAVAAALLALNHLISKWKEAMQAAIDYDVVAGNIEGRALRFAQTVSVQQGSVSAAALAQARADAEQLSKEIEKQQRIIKDIGENAFSPADSAKVTAAKKQLETLIPAYDRLQSAIAGVKTVAKDAPAIAGGDKPAPIAALNSLTEAQETALNKISSYIVGLERQDAAQRALLVALKESPEAYKAESRAQEINNAVFEIRQQLLESELSLSPQLEAKIRALTGSIFDSNVAAEKYNQALSDLAASVSALSSIRIPKLETGGDQQAVKEWAGSLSDLGFELNSLRSNLQRLPKDSAEYRKGILVLAETEKRYQAEISKLPQILADRKAARTSEIRSVLSVAESITRSINEEIVQLGRGSAAWDEYAKAVEVKARAIQILGVFNLPKPDGSDTAALAEWQSLFDKWKAQFASLSATISLRIDADATAELRRSLESPRQVFEQFAEEVSRYVSEGLLSEKEARKILFRANELTGAMRDTVLAAAEDISTSLADGLVEAAFEGGEAWDNLADQLESIFKRLIADWLSQWIRAMAQWLARWIATQAAAKAASAALGTGGGGAGAGGWGSVFSMAGQAMGGGGAGGGAAGAGMGTMASLGAVAAIYIAIYAGVKSWINSHKENISNVTFQLSGDVGAAVNSIYGSKKRIVGLTDTLKEAGEAINDWLKELGGALDGLSGSVTLGSKGKGKKTQHFVISEGVRTWFKTYEEALEFALLEALESSNVRGFSELMQQGLAESGADSLDDLKDFISTLREISDLSLTPGAVNLRNQLQQLNNYFDELSKLGSLTPAVAQGFADIANAVGNVWQAWSDSITGRQKTRKELEAEKENERVIFNARKALFISETELKKLDIQREIDYLEGLAAGVGAEGNIGYTRIKLFSTYLTAMAEGVEAEGKIEQARIDLLKNSLAALDAILAALPKDIMPGDINIGNVGGSSGPSPAELREDLRKEIARMVAEAAGEIHTLVFDFDQAIEDITERAKEAKLPAEELAAAIALMTQKLQAEIRARAEAAAGIGTDFTRRLRDVLDLFREIRELGRKKTGMPNWLVDLLEGKALAKLGAEIGGAIAAFNGLTDPMLAIEMQAAELQEGFLAWAQAAGLSAEEIAKGLAAIESGKEFQRQNAITGIMETIFGYLKDAPEYAGKLVEFEKMKIDLQFKIIEAQLRALGAWDEGTQKMVEDAKKIALELAEGGRELDRSVARFRGYNDDESDPWRRVQDFVKDQTQAFRAGIKGLIESTQDLFTDDQLTNLTQEEQLAAARARVMDLIAKAEGGDVEALGDLAAARAEFLSELRESEGAGFGFDQGWDEIMGRTADLLANASNIEADVVAKAWEDAIANDDENTEDITEAIYDSARLLAQEIRDAINGVPALAAGGIVMSGPRLVRVAEHSPEAIVPLDRLMSAIPYTYQEPSDKIGPTAPTLPTAPTVSVYDQSERFRQFQRQNDSANRLSKIEESNRAMAMTMARMQQDMSALRRKMM